MREKNTLTFQSPRTTARTAGTPPGYPTADPEVLYE
jgi:hypothetical protein